ncbi:MAG: DUF4382 domain-containing protein [Flavobacterium sp.]|uniref:DUF4382 domain-containing protein n=1 Tax=Flavobacterium sp. TaxID=239 RepID=UPI0032638031
MKKLILMLSIVAGVSMFSSCSNDNSTGSGDYAYKVRMTDAPGPYDSVNIDLQGVEVTGNNGETVMLNTTEGMYNLLDYSNGTSVLIANSNLVDADVQQIRLILGSNSTVVVDGVTYPLSTPSAEQSGLKINVNQTLSADVDNEILLDFDAGASIIQTGNGTYKLKPVLRTVVATSGTIRGSITPIGNAMVTATSATSVEYTSSTNDAGQFQISGLPAGTYTLTITPELPLLPIIQTDVVVTTGVVTNVGIITF